MNKARRNRIIEIIDTLTLMNEEINILMDEEQEALEAMPESLQESDRGDAMQEAIDNLSSAMDSVQEAIDSLEEAKG